MAECSVSDFAVALGEEPASIDDGKLL